MRHYGHPGGNINIIEVFTGKCKLSATYCVCARNIDCNPSSSSLSYREPNLLHVPFPFFNRLLNTIACPHTFGAVAWPERARACVFVHIIITFGVSAWVHNLITLRWFRIQRQRHVTRNPCAFLAFYGVFFCVVCMSNIACAGADTRAVWLFSRAGTRATVSNAYSVLASAFVRVSRLGVDFWYRGTLDMRLHAALFKGRSNIHCTINY